MGIQDWSDNIILVDVAPEPQMSEELKTVTKIASERGNCSVVVDFSDAELVTSSSLAQLLRLRKVLEDCEQQLILCGLNNRAKSVFAVTGLEKVFDFVDDRFVALAGLQVAM